MQDYYEILQVHPNADQEIIQAAYERMRMRYDPTQLDGVAEELVELARQKRHDIERAYTILNDARRRAAYDAERRLEDQRSQTTRTEDSTTRHVTAELLDYRPLPPARRQERPRDFNTQPVLSVAPRQRSGRRTRSTRPPWMTPVIVVGITTFVILLSSLLITTLQGPSLTATESTGGMTLINTPQSESDAAAVERIMNQFEGQIVQARLVAQQRPDNFNSWMNLGDALYDSVQIVRERMPDSELYQERLPRWIEASEAYSEALAIDPTHIVARADLAASLCKYGASANDPVYVAAGLAEAQRAVQAGPDDARALLHLGVCLASSNPPQIEAAMQQWQKVLTLPSVPRGIIVETQQLMQQYQQ